MFFRYEEYEKRLIDQCTFQIACLATIEDTKFEYYAQDDFRVRKPDIKINLVGAAIQGQEATADVVLENPLPVQLRKCEFAIDTPGSDKKQKVKLKKNILAGEKASAQIKFTPTELGRQTIAAKFVSKELKDVDGYLVFMVESKKSEANGNS